MAILIDKDTRVLIQGITGNVGSFQTKVMKDYGTQVVAGITPGKGGTSIHGIPVYDFVAEAVAAHPIDAAFGFVPGRASKDAAFEVIEAGIPFLVITTEGVPNLDMLQIIQYARQKGTRVIGPDTAGLISPGKCKLGVHPNRMFMEGNVGVLSKSGALSYEVGKNLTENGVGQSTVVGIGGGPFWGMTQPSVLELFEADPETKAVVLLGEVGGTMELEAAEYIKAHMTKPVVALIVGRSAPEGAQMGHAGAIIEGKEGTAASKIAALRAAGAHIASRPGEIPQIIKSLGVLS
jgi:succinyl-CoA synthetase alpha subunit